MKRKSRTDGHSGFASMPTVMEMVDRKGDGDSNVSSLLMEIRDELRQHNTILQNLNKASTRDADTAVPTPSTPTDSEIV